LDTCWQRGRQLHTDVPSLEEGKGTKSYTVQQKESGRKSRCSATDLLL